MSRESGKSAAGHGPAALAIKQGDQGRKMLAGTETEAANENVEQR